MLLIWYTPPPAGAQPNYAQWLMSWRESMDDEETLILLWWMLNE